MLDEGITRTEIGAALRRTPSTIAKKVRGDVPWTVPELHELRQFLAKRLGRPVSWDEILDGADAAERMVGGEVHA